VAKRFFKRAKSSEQLRVNFSLSLIQFGGKSNVNLIQILSIFEFFMDDGRNSVHRHSWKDAAMLEIQ
jgi:hypothetical protein